jgi:hypothetical protein
MASEEREGSRVAGCKTAKDLEKRFFGNVALFLEQVWHVGCCSD